MSRSARASARPRTTRLPHVTVSLQLQACSPAGRGGCFLGSSASATPRRRHCSGSGRGINGRKRSSWRAGGGAPWRKMMQPDTEKRCSRTPCVDLPLHTAPPRSLQSASKGTQDPPGDASCFPSLCVYYYCVCGLV